MSVIRYPWFSYLDYCISYREAFHFNMVLLNINMLNAFFVVP